MPITRPSPDIPEDLIRVLPVTRSDGSVIWDVYIGAEHYAAVTENDALEFADKIVSAINEHTTHLAIAKVFGA